MAHSERHFNSMVVALSQRLAEHEDAVDPTESAEPAVIGVEQLPPPSRDETRETALIRVQRELEGVLRIAETVGAAVERQGEMVEAIADNVSLLDETSGRGVVAAERAIVRRYYPSGYRAAPCWGLFDRSCALRVLLLWCLLFFVFVFWVF